MKFDNNAFGAIEPSLIKLLTVDDLKLIFKWYPNELNNYVEDKGFNLLAFGSYVSSGDVFVDDKLENLLKHSVNWEKTRWEAGANLNRTGFEFNEGHFIKISKK